MLSADILSFYQGEASDHCGRYVSEIQQWSDDRLESTHDYIQWLFPLEEASGFNLHAPKLDTATIRTFRSNPEVRQVLRTSLLRMLAFYGFGMSVGPPPIVQPCLNFEQQAKNWLTPSNHNHLRISRVLKCLRLLGLQAEADAFFHCLEMICASESQKQNPGITAETFFYWERAVLEPNVQG